MAEVPDKPKKETVNGHSTYEAISALQKSIRRGEVDDAMYWMTDLVLSGEEWWLWKRLRIIVSEDVGPAWAEGPTTIQALYQMAYSTKEHALFAGDAVYRLCKAQKTRIIDNITYVHREAHAQLRRDVPDYALDMHTVRGRMQGRGIDHFLDEAAVIFPEDRDGGYGDSWKERARKIDETGLHFVEPDAQPELAEV